MLGTESRRIAIATTDGKTVHQHFGHADVFSIIEIQDQEFHFIEQRHVPPACNDHEHTQDSFAAVWEILSDCKGVVVGKIGPSAATFLLEKGIQIFESVGFVDEIVQQLIAQNLLRGDAPT
jgi:predicted Fe-Mo cluster-binding NifX family protein